MKRIGLIAGFALWSVLHPSLREAEARVYVTVSVGGMVIVGAGVIFWGVSYTSRIGDLNVPPSETRSKALFSTRDRMKISAAAAPRVIPEAGPERKLTPGGLTEIEIPILVYRW